MERITDKHGARLDEAMDREVASLVEGAPVEARSQEGRMQESTPEPRTPLDMRAELAASVAPVQWPATRDELVRTARAEFAVDDVVALIDSLPHGDRRYSTVQEVWEAVNQ